MKKCYFFCPDLVGIFFCGDSGSNRPNVFPNYMLNLSLMYIY